ncbi:MULTISPECIES: hypothetical protein [unclassified Streptomyces]|uniref:hypothetical protein n=1 Tax=unclassified Streptomyces TaxID=2593676 RepID=UPI000DC77DD7|nr:MULTISPECIES: hypothetical protein [unclassified Streptomyces]AWZ06238.1 hypothetical protein DRB89_18205 [Streptomyces sp. ICC4]AWZ13236.1 hypothetical protein DRB96_13955 [Streptomyces sp. ICC1]
MTEARTIQRLIRLAAGLPLVLAPLLLTTSPAHGDPTPTASPCAAVTVPEGHACVPDPKQCFTTPCPQYTVVPLPETERTPLVRAISGSGTIGNHDHSP